MNSSKKQTGSAPVKYKMRLPLTTEACGITHSGNLATTTDTLYEIHAVCQKRHTYQTPGAKTYSNIR